MTTPRRYRAGESVEDYCRVCRIDRLHTVQATDAEGRPLRVICGYCGSTHNYRGGPRVSVTASGDRGGPEAGVGASRTTEQRSGPAGPPRATPAREPFDLVTERERSQPPMALDTTPDLERLLRRIIREEAGVTPAVPAEKWRDGHLVLRPGAPGLQEKIWPIETFFHKVVMLRNRLRTLEQQLNASDLPDDAKVKLQGYVTACYGSLTSFNVLFADAEDQFKGSGGE